MSLSESRRIPLTIERLLHHSQGEVLVRIALIKRRCTAALCSINTASAPVYWSERPSRFQSLFLLHDILAGTNRNCSTKHHFSNGSEVFPA